MSASKAKQECRRSRCATPAKTEYSCTRGSFCTVCTIWVSSTLEGVTFFLVHRKVDVPKDLTGIDVVVYGHSHKLAMEEKDGVLWLNPGSCGPRRFHQPITMMMADVTAGQIQVQPITMPHEEA